MKDDEKKVWTPTKTQGLLRHANGVYYARLFLGGKEKWKSLRTKAYAVALTKLGQFRNEVKEAGAQDASLQTGKLTFGRAVKAHLQRLERDPDRKQSTRRYHNQLIAALQKDWPGLMDKPLNRITREACSDWASRFSASATRFNGTVHLLRAIFAIGIESGAITANPAEGVKRRKVRPRKPELPTREQFRAMVEAIRTAGGRYSKSAADLVEGLAFTGMRLGEAANVEWRDVDLEAGRLHIRGDAETGTKNWTTRKIPLAPEAAALFRRMGEQGSRSGFVFAVHEAQKSLDRAAKEVGCPRVTHHDLRDLFATTCIEAGIDIPTVSKWLGHQDGGALLMRAYGHLRDEHSQAAAARISFAPSIPKESAQPQNAEPSSSHSPQSP